MRPRIALDTNLLVAALTKPDGASGRIVEAWRRREVDLVVSEDTIREAQHVLGAGWLARVTSHEAVERLLANLRSDSIIVQALREPLDVSLKDPGDRRMLEAAVAGRAKFVVTTDRESLSHRGYGDVEFVTPSEFWKRPSG